MEEQPVPDHIRQRRLKVVEINSAEPHQNPIVERLFSVSRDIRERYFARPVTTFTDIGGIEHHAAADQFEADVNDPANVRVWLKTHEKEIAMTVGGLLLAAGLIKLQNNRSQRQKMSKRASSYKRKPRKNT